jgi:hypothetical protein
LTPALGLLALGAITLHLESAEDVSLEDASQILSHLADRIEKRAGEKPSIDDLDWPACPDSGECLSSIRLRTHADEVMLVRLVGGINKVRLIATRIAKDAPLEGAPQAQADLSRHAPNGFGEEALERLGARAVPGTEEGADDGSSDRAPCPKGHGRIAAPPPVGVRRGRRGLGSAGDRLWALEQKRRSRPGGRPPSRTGLGRPRLAHENGRDPRRSVHRSRGRRAGGRYCPLGH